MVEPVLRKMIHKRHDGAAALDESSASIHVGDVRELVVRNVQQPRQLHPICRRLVEHDEELAVRQHGAGRVGLEQILDVLANPGPAGSVLSHTLPQGEEEIGAVLMLEQQVG